MKDTSNKPLVADDSELELELSESSKVTPLRCFVGSILSTVMGFGLYSLFNSIVQTYAVKPITSTSPIAVNLSAAVRTLVMGTVALATGVFAMVAIGIFLLGIQLTLQNLRKA